MIFKKLLHRYRSFFKKYKSLKNENFLSILMTSNPGMFNSGNLYCMDYAIKNMPKGAMLEIGSYAGLSTNVLLHLIRLHQRKTNVYTCDRWLFEEPLVSEFITRLYVEPKEFSNFIKDSFVRNVYFFNRGFEPHTIDMTSDMFFEHWAAKKNAVDVFGREVTLGEPLAFAYIDGNHTYEFALRDFQNADQYLVKGGFILMDDSADHLRFGAVKVAQEMSKRKDYEVVIKNPNYLFRKK